MACCRRRASPRELLELAVNYDGESGTERFLQKVDWSSVSPHQIYYSILGRLPESASAVAEALQHDPKLLASQALSSSEFQSKLISFILNALPEKRRLIFVHIPKCAGTDLTQNLVEEFPYVHDHHGKAEWTSPEMVLGVLKAVATRALQTNGILVAGHIPLSVHMDRGMIRFGDRVFAIVRHPFEIAISQVNYVLRRFWEAPDTDRQIAGSGPIF